MPDKALDAWLLVIERDPPDDPAMDEVAGWLAGIEALRADVLRFLKAAP